MATYVDGSARRTTSPAAYAAVPWPAALTAMSREEARVAARAQVVPT